MVAVVLLAALDVTTILVSSLLGVIAMFLTGCLTPDEAYEDIDWMVLVLLGSIIPLGLAMQNTGTAQLLAAGCSASRSRSGCTASLAALYLLTSLLTEVISNNAAAVVLTPVAVAAALGARRLAAPLRDRGDVRRVQQLPHPDRLPDEHLHLTGPAATASATSPAWARR
jgi:di/tricarboxylate transporter